MKKILIWMLIGLIFIVSLIWATTTPTVKRSGAGYDSEKNGFADVLGATSTLRASAPCTTTVFDLAQYKSASWQCTHSLAGGGGDSINYYFKLYLSLDGSHFWCIDSTLYYSVDSAKYKMGFTTAAKMEATYGKVIITPKNAGLDSAYTITWRLKRSQ